VRAVFDVVVFALGVYFAVYILGTLVMTALAIVVTRRRRHEILPSTLRRIMRAEAAPTVSVCVPAYNESAVVVDTVRSLLALDYPRVEVVVANDGSTDTTLAVLQEEFDLRPSERPRLGDLPHAPIRGLYEPRAPIPLLVVDKENGGRADALNAAIVHASGPLVTVVDADEVLAHDTLGRAVRPFLADPDRTVAVGANLGIANGCRIVRGRIVERGRPRRILPLYQAIEYDRSFRIARGGAGAMRAIPIISGGFGVFRRDVLIAAGGYAGDTLGEDFDVTLRLHRFMHEAGLPYRIVHVPNVVCWTIVPETSRVLRRQRRRWHRALQQVLWKQRGMALRPRYRLLGLFSIPWAWMYELITPVVIVLAMLTTAIGFALGWISVHTLVFGALVTWGWIVAPTLAALLLTDAPGGSSKGWRDLGAVVAAAFTDWAYQLLTLGYRVESMVWLRRRVAWGEMERSTPVQGSP
jgi:cellulose synthase/poly-beta-1,6-N-acetylglucosamine synthase-like glycosyltransferase